MMNLRPLVFYSVYLFLFCCGSVDSAKIPKKPSNFTLNDPKYKKVEATWNKQTGIDGYFLEVHQDLVHDSKLYNLSKDATSFIYDGDLLVGTKYTLSLRAYNYPENLSPDTPPESYIRSDYVKKEFTIQPLFVPRYDLVAYNDTITLKWVPDSVAEKEDAVYLVQAKSNDKKAPFEHRWFAKPMNTSFTCVPHVIYEIKLSACFDTMSESCGASSTQRTTCPSSYPSVPLNLEVVERLENSIMIKWQEPEVPNGVLSGYLVGIGTTESIEAYTDIKKTLQHTFNSDINGRSEYYIEVIAFNREFRRTPDVLKSPPAKLKVGKTHVVPITLSAKQIKFSNTLDVTWTYTGTHEVHNYTVRTNCSTADGELSEWTTHERHISIELIAHYGAVCEISVMPQNDDTRQPAVRYIIWKGVPAPESVDVQDGDEITVVIGKPSIPEAHDLLYQCVIDDQDFGDSSQQSDTFRFPRQPFRTYTIKARLCYDLECGPVQTRIIKTPAEKPSPPIDIKLYERFETSFTITWRPPVTPNGPIDGYLVNILDLQENKRSESIAVASNTTRYRFDAVKKDAKYQTSVQAYNLKEDAKDTAENQITSDYATLDIHPYIGLDTPETLDVRFDEANNLLASWSPNNATRDQVKSYHVAVIDENGLTIIDNLTVDNEILVGTDLLQAFTLFRIHVQSCSTMEMSSCGYSHSASIRSSMQAPTAPTEAAIIDRQRDGVDITWQTPLLLNGPLTGYLIEIQQTTNKTDDKWIRLTKDKTMHSFSELQNGLEYVVYLQAYNLEEGTEDVIDNYLRSETIILEVPKWKGPGAPKNLDILFTPDVLSISWDMPEDSPCLISNHHILVNRLGSEGNTLVFNKIVPSTVVSIDFEPYTKYEVAVGSCCSISANTCGEDSVLIARSPPSAPSSPLGLKTTKTDETEFNVAWTPPKFLNGKLDGYQIGISLVDEVPEVMETIPSDKTTSTFRFLDQKSKHYVFVVAFNKDQDRPSILHLSDPAVLSVKFEPRKESSSPGGLVIAAVVLACLSVCVAGVLLYRRYYRRFREDQQTIIGFNANGDDVSVQSLRT